MHGTKRAWLWPLVFLAPTIAGLVVFRLVPIVWSFGLSFVDWQIFDTPQFAGLDNFTDIFRVPELRRVLGVTGLFALIYIPGVVSLALILAVTLNRAVFGMGFFRGAFFPAVHHLDGGGDPCMALDILHTLRSAQ